MKGQRTGIGGIFLSLAGAIVLLALIAVVQIALPGAPREITDPASVEGGSWAGVMLVVAVLLVPWLRSVLLRCPDPLIRRNLIFIAAILSLWMLMVAIKYETSNALLSSILWYCYYAPFCLIPALALECAVFAANLDKVKGVVSAIKLVSCLALFLVLTNNIHHLVFQFSFDDATWASNYSYGVGYALVVGWIALVMGAFVATLLYSAHRARRRVVLLLLAFLCVVALYAVLHVLRALPLIARNAPFSYCLLVILLVEFCLRTGMLPSYSNYEQAFRRLPFDARILDREKRTVMQSAGFEAASEELIAARLPDLSSEHAAKQGVLQLSEDHIAGKYAQIEGGYVVVVENVAELENRRVALANRQAELRDRMKALSSSQEIESRLCQLQAESALCLEIEQELSRAVAKIRSLLDALPAQEDELSVAKRQRMLYQVKLLLSYCKRQGGLILASKDDRPFGEERLLLAVSETVEDLRTSGVECAVLPTIERAVPVSVVHDFYECLYLLGVRALMMSEPQMMASINAGQESIARFRIALESATVESLSDDEVADMLLHFETLSVRCEVLRDEATLYLIAAEVGTDG